MGGLGNQLFQIFTAIAYGMRYRRKVVFSYSDYLTVGTIRTTYWNTFLKSIRFMTTDNNVITNKDLETFQLYRESNYHYDELTDKQYPNIMLYGYFQSYKYFENERYSIISMLRLRQWQQLARGEFPLLFSENMHYISMHFRLGDYVNLQDHHPLMPYTYYENALRFILSKRKDNKPIRILYFCQVGDNEVVSKIIKQLIQDFSFSNETFIKMDDAIPDWKQMLLMSCCHDNIIANSTFSWWGGYFNETSDKIVCYPEKWFGPKLTNNDTRDLFPDDWHKIHF
uniref:Glycosyltransferase n=1 Tax=viral metagenome TaxID=1070528 RepID=A0A6C0DUN7_9ZZZZ